jgi:hypothetical protein
MMLSKMILQAFLISASLIVNGGEIRRQSGAKRNQSVNTPLMIHLSIIFLQVSAFSNSKPAKALHGELLL